MPQIDRTQGEIEEPPQVIRLRIEADAKLVDILSDFLVGMLDGAVEQVVDDNAQEGTVIHGYFSVERHSNKTQLELEQRVRTYGSEIARICKAAEPLVSSEPIPSQDWSEKWKTYFKPFEIIPGLVIAPSWEDYPKPETGHLIVMDPGMAFGTGHHATTRLCLEMVKRVVQGSCRYVLDVGTGTGILAMAAALFGADRVVGIDNDPEAVSAAGENVRTNNLEKMVSITSEDVADITGTFDLVVANIVHDVLIFLATDLARVTSSGGCLVLSGLISGTQVENIVREFGARSFRFVEEARETEWSSLLFIKH